MGKVFTKEMLIKEIIKHFEGHVGDKKKLMSRIPHYTSPLGRRIHWIQQYLLHAIMIGK